MLRSKKNSQAKLAYCDKCGKLFSSLHGEKLCPSCNAVDQAAQDKMKEYLRENPKASLKEAAEATGAPADSLKRLSIEVMSAKLNSNKKVDAVYPCANCGTMIKSGTYCPACAAELQKKAQQSASANSVLAPTREDSQQPREVKGLDNDFNNALKEKPAATRRRMYQGVIDQRRSK